MKARLVKPLILPDGEVWPVGKIVECLPSPGGFEVDIGDRHFCWVPTGTVEPFPPPRTALERLVGPDWLGRG